MRWRGTVSRFSRIKAGYEDPQFPEFKLFILALKTTCKDRWRQVLQEAPRIRQKHLLILQEGISENQLAEMAAARVTLVVPQKLHASYGNGAPALLSVQQFIDQVRRAMAA